jgi:hypothetical protein
MDPKMVENVSGQLSEGSIINRIVKVNPSHRSRPDSRQENAKKGKIDKKIQQPFTDVQQAQLGAQILVYGSLMQGAAPDAATMVSAFGSSDKTRHVWEPTWHACLQRLQGTKTSNQANKRSPLQRHKDPPLPGGQKVSLSSQQNNIRPYVTEAIKVTTVKESSPVLDSALKNSITVEPAAEKEVIDIESKLASAALAMSAATSAAELAALAAKIASNAALQVKLLADEEISRYEKTRSDQNEGIVLPVKSSNIIAAKEASRRRVEAASAALKHATNVSEIVKAAELTVDAVNQARKILIFFDPDYVSNDVRDLSSLNTEMQTEISRVPKNDLTKELLS